MINLNLMEINLIPIKLAEQQHHCQQLCDTAHVASCHRSDSSVSVVISTMPAIYSQTSLSGYCCNPLTPSLRWISFVWSRLDAM